MIEGWDLEKAFGNDPVGGDRLLRMEIQNQRL